MVFGTPINILLLQLKKDHFYNINHWNFYSFYFVVKEHEKYFQNDKVITFNEWLSTIGKEKLYTVITVYTITQSNMWQSLENTVINTSLITSIWISFIIYHGHIKYKNLWTSCY